MNNDDVFRRAIHRALDPMVRPVPNLASDAMRRVHGDRGQPAAGARLGRVGRTIGVLAAAALVAVIVLGSHQATRHGPPPARDQGYRVVPAAPAGLTAWLSEQAGFTGIDPNGQILTTIPAPAMLRSVDGRRLYAIWSKAVYAYDAATGKAVQSITRRAGGTVATLSPDGRYLLVYDSGPSGATLEVIDLQAGRSAAMLAMGSVLPNEGPIYLLADVQAAHIYVVTADWIHPALGVVAFDGTALRLEQHVLDGQSGHAVPGCDGEGDPNSASGPPERLLPDGTAMVIVCPGDGLVSWFDLRTLTTVKQLRVHESNPFWLSPVFSPDGTMLYLHEGGTGRITAVDLRQRAIVGTTVVKSVAQLDPFSWVADRLFPPAFAGGIPRTAAISSDGGYLYVTGSFGGPGGIWAVHLPDLTPVRSFRNARGAGMWLSGDGRTLYVSADDGLSVSVLQLDTGAASTVHLAAPGFDFLDRSPAA